MVMERVDRMHDTDTDIDTLERLLPQARADYRALRHGAELHLPAARPRPRPVRRLAIVASVAGFAGLLGLLALIAAAPEAPVARGTVPSPGTFPQPPRFDFARTARPSLTVRRPNFSLSLPQRPDGSNG